MTPTPTITDQTSVSKKKNPLIIILLLFLIIGIGFGGFFILKNFKSSKIVDSKSLTQANILTSQATTQTPEEIILAIQNNFIDGWEKNPDILKKDTNLTTKTQLSITDITAPIPIKINNAHYTIESKNSSLKFDTQNQKFFLDGNGSFDIGVSISSGNKNYNIGLNGLADGKIWVDGTNSGIYLSPRKFDFNLTGVDYFKDMFSSYGNTSSSIAMQTNFSNWLLGVKLVGAAARSIGKGFSGKVIYISTNDIKNSSLEKNNSIGDSFKDLPTGTGENYLKTLPLFVYEKTGDRYILKQNPAFTGGMISQSLASMMYKKDEKGNYQISMPSSMIFGSIFASALIPRMTGAQSQARDMARMAGANQLKAGLETYYADNGYYPSFESGTDTKNLYISMSGYMSSIPSDPQSGKIWQYQSFKSGQNYALILNIEDQSKSNLENFGVTGKNIYLVKDNGSSEIDKNILQKTINNFSSGDSKNINNENIAYFDYLPSGNYKLTPIDSNSSGQAYIIFDTKNILEAKFSQITTGQNINFEFKNGNLSGNLTTTDGNTINVSGQIDNSKKTIQANFILKSIMANGELNFSSQNLSGNENTKINLSLNSSFGKINLVSETTTQNGNDFNIKIPEKYDYDLKNFTGQVGKVILNDPEIINIGLDFFSNQVQYGLQSKIENSDLTGGLIDLNIIDNEGPSIKQGINNELEQNNQLKDIGANKFIDTVSSKAVFKIAVIKFGLKNYFQDNGSYPESNLGKISSLDGLDKYFKNLPQDIFYKSISKDGQKNSCYILIALSKGGITNSNIKGFNDLSKIETYENYQKILNYESTTGKYFISSCD